MPPYPPSAPTTLTPEQRRAQLGQYVPTAVGSSTLSPVTSTTSEQQAEGAHHDLALAPGGALTRASPRLSGPTMGAPCTDSASMMPTVSG